MFSLYLDGITFDPVARDLKTFTAGKFVLFQSKFNGFFPCRPVGIGQCVFVEADIAPREPAPF